MWLNKKHMLQSWQRLNESLPMHNYLEIFISLFAIMNPVLALTVYLNVTHGLSRAHKQLVIIVCGITTFIILTFLLFFGNTLLELLGIHAYALQLGGGILFLLMGITTIIKYDDKRDNLESANMIVWNRRRIISLGVSPLGIPMIVGPGGIVMIILFGQSTPDITSKLIITGLIVILCIIVVVFFSLADIISKIMGDLGILVMSKMLGVLITAIAFELIVAGIKAVLPSLVAVITK